jgi:Tfp pilus assembly major pilin PilA
MTFVEILVVLAILGSLLAVTVLKVIPVLARGKYAAVALATDQLRKASVAYLTKPGSLGVLPLSEGVIPGSQYTLTSGGTAENVAAAATIDQVFVAEGYLDKPLNLTLAGTNPVPAAAAVGVVWNVPTQRWMAAAAPTLDLSTSARAETIISNPALLPAAAGGANFNLNGDGQTMIPANVVVEYLTIPNCPAQQALELSVFMDGASLSENANTTADGRGAVVYPAPTAGFTTVCVYVTQQ